MGLVAVTFIVIYLIYSQSAIGPGGTSALVGQPVSSGDMNAITGVSANTLSAVGQGPSGLVSPRPITGGSNLTLNGKPEVLYIGGDYCPYCAAERWAILVALTKFGNFTGIEYMQSSATDVYSSTSTFTFAHANYTSNYISFVAVEYWDRSDNIRTSLTSTEQSLFSQYSPNQNIPFVDLANVYLLGGSQYPPSVLRVGNNVNGAPYDWTQIGSQLNNSSSIFAQNVDGAANHLISAICKIDGSKPANVCSQPFAQLLGYTRSPSSSLNAGLMIADIPQASQSIAPRFTPSRLTIQS